MLHHAFATNQVWSLMGGTKCKGMDGLIDEGGKIMAESLSDEVVDAAIIGCCQKTEHYEIAAYGTARALAEQLGMIEVAQLLQQMLIEEQILMTGLLHWLPADVNLRAEVASNRTN